MFINMLRINVLRILLYRPKFTLTNAVIKYFQALSDGSLVVSTNPYSNISVQYKEWAGSGHAARFDFYHTTFSENSFY